MHQVLSHLKGAIYITAGQRPAGRIEYRNLPEREDNKISTTFQVGVYEFHFSQVVDLRL